MTRPDESDLPSLFSFQLSFIAIRHNLHDTGMTPATGRSALQAAERSGTRQLPFFCATLSKALGDKGRTDGSRPHLKSLGMIQNTDHLARDEHHQKYGEGDPSDQGCEFRLVRYQQLKCELENSLHEYLSLGGPAVSLHPQNSMAPCPHSCGWIISTVVRRYFLLHNLSAGIASTAGLTTGLASNASERSPRSMVRSAS